MEDQTTFDLYDKIHALESQVHLLEKQVERQESVLKSFKTGAAGVGVTLFL